MNIIINSISASNNLILRPLIMRHTIIGSMKNENFNSNKNYIIIIYKKNNNNNNINI